MKTSHESYRARPITVRTHPNPIRIVLDSDLVIGYRSSDSDPRRPAPHTKEAGIGYQWRRARGAEKEMRIMRAGGVVVCRGPCASALRAFRIKPSIRCLSSSSTAVTTTTTTFGTPFLTFCI